MTSSAATADFASSPSAGAGSQERPGKVPPRLLLAGIIGNTLERYDFAAYGFLAAVYAKNFFPTSDPFVGLISAFGVFAASTPLR